MPLKGSTFEDRRNAAADAKKALVERFKARPPADDPEVLARAAERRAVQEARELRQAERARQKALEDEAKARENEVKKAEDEIKKFCESKFNVSFPMFSKLHVNGPEQHPLYEALTGKNSPVPGPVKWNFGKFLIGRDGKVLARFDSGVKPDAPELAAAIDAALAAK